MSKQCRQKLGPMFHYLGEMKDQLESYTKSKNYGEELKKIRANSRQRNLPLHHGSLCRH